MFEQTLKNIDDVLHKDALEDYELDYTNKLHRLCYCIN